MKRQRSKLEITKSSSHNECRRISNSNTVEISDDAIVESTSPSSTRVRVRKQSKKISDDQITNLDSLPIDVIMEIFKRLSVKTLARFVSVSKFWASIIRSQDFNKLFLTKSSNRVDRLVFTMKNNDEDYFCFSLQTHDSGKALIATYHEIYLEYPYTFNVSSVHDLICFGTEFAYGLVVYNTSTRRSITLPKFDSQSFVIKHFFLGYDPIDGVYKVLCMTGQKQTREQKLVLHVLTLANENSWKMIEDVATHKPINQQICINGVIYYEAYADTGKKMRELVVMSFDGRSEKFDIIKRPVGDSLGYSSIMIRYKEKLAIVFGDVSANGDIVFWVLEDAVKHEWLKKVFNWRNSWINLAWRRFRPLLHDNYRLVDVNDAGEFILAPIRLSESPFNYVLYYDSKTNSMRKVLILGITEPKRLHWVKRQSYFPRYLFSSQVESLMFL